VDSLLIEAGFIITLGKQGVIKDGAILIENGRLAVVGKLEDARRKAGRGCERIDAKRRIVMPGFFPAHTHLYSMLLRALPPAKLPAAEVPATDFQQILQSFWWPSDESLDADILHASALAGAMEYAKMGVTCFAETLSAPEAIEGGLDHQEKGVDEVGIKGFTGFEATERRGEAEGRRGLRENERFIRKQKGRKTRVKAMTALHAPLTVSDDLLIQSKKMADRYGTPIHMHCCEGLGDVYNSYERYGLRPLERLKKVGFLGSNVCLAHCIQLMEDPDIKILADTKTSVAHDPWPNMFEGAGLAPFPELQSAGVNVGLGDDAYVLDPFQNMRFFMSAHAGARRDPRLINPHLALSLYTQGSANCFGVGDSQGSLEVGKSADFIAVEPSFPTVPVSVDNVVDFVVNFVSGHDVKTTVVEGEMILKEGKLTRLDEEKAFARCRKQATRLWDRISSMKLKLDVLKLS
jgi:cytosine/adenosine deaminase-related metal-dependent hydrolase